MFAVGVVVVVVVVVVVDDDDNEEEEEVDEEEDEVVDASRRGDGNGDLSGETSSAAAARPLSLSSVVASTSSRVLAGKTRDSNKDDLFMSFNQSIATKRHKATTKTRHLAFTIKRASDQRRSQSERGRRHAANGAVGEQSAMRVLQRAAAARALTKQQHVVEQNHGTRPNA